MTPEAALLRILTSPTADESWFASSFLVAVPIATVDAVMARARKHGGAYKSVRALGGSKYEVAFERTLALASIHLDDAGAVTGFRIVPAPTELPAEAIRASFCQMSLSVVMCVALGAWALLHRASLPVLVFMAGVLILTVGAYVQRIRAARRTLAIGNADSFERFARAERQSHRIRGRVYLVTAPIVVAVTWWGVLKGPSPPVDELAMNAVIALFLIGAWVAWWRTVKRLGPLLRS